jgi:tight adherence protein C
MFVALGVNIDVHFVLRIISAIAVMGAVISVVLPLLVGDPLARRMKVVALESERILARANESSRLRQSPKAYMRRIVRRFSLEKWLGVEDLRFKLAQAGFRGQQAEIAFLFFRFVTAIGFLALGAFYFFVFDDSYSSYVKTLGMIASLYLGIKAPEVYISNVITKRQQSMQAAFPDAMDLMLICVEAGMSIESAFRRISKDIGLLSIPLAEEFSLATAELSYLPDRRTAYTNLAQRTGLEIVKMVAIVLIQAEKHGTPTASALRTTAAESRHSRMLEAEKKAAALPPKLTVPMMLTFIPALFLIILGPAILMAMKA